MEIVLSAIQFYWMDDSGNSDHGNRFFMDQSLHECCNYGILRWDIQRRVPIRSDIFYNFISWYIGDAVLHCSDIPFFCYGNNFNENLASQRMQTLHFGFLCLINIKNIIIPYYMVVVQIKNRYFYKDNKYKIIVILHIIYK